MSVAGQIERPQLGAFFRLSITGVDAVNFSECVGLSSEMGTEEYPEGGENRFVHRFPVRGSSPNLVLSRGVASSDALWTWYAQHLTGYVLPRDGQIELLTKDDDSGRPARVWAFRRGYPVKIAGPDLNAMTSAIAIESIEIAHHGISLVPLAGI